MNFMKKSLVGLLLGMSLANAAKADDSITNLVLTVTNNMTVTWNWQQEYQVVAASSGNGSVSRNNDWVAAGSNYLNTAVPNQYFVFDKWNGVPSHYQTINPLVLPVTGPLNISASFKPAAYTPMGTPFSWLAQYNLTPDDDAVDTDGDGMLNWQEFVADTNPTNVLSYFKPLQIAPSAMGFQLTQPDSSTNRLYEILSKAQLNIGEWNAVTNQVGNGSNLTFQLQYKPQPSEMFRSNVRLRE